MTVLSHDPEAPFRYHGAASPPVFATSTYVFDTVAAIEATLADHDQGYTYSRSRNPTVVMVEEKLAALEGGEAACCFGSGMAAISAAILACVESGTHVVCVDTAYGPTREFLAGFLPRFGVETTFIPGDDPAEWEAAARPNTRVFYLESPSTMVFRLQDLAAVAAVARARGIATLIDNTWATPLFQKPLALGVDLSIHTATKYFGGHSDLMGGVVVGAADRIGRLAKAERELLGGILAPAEAWLLLRGLRTLPLRMAHHHRAGLAVAGWLEQQPQVRRVLHPGLPSHPQHALYQRQMQGGGSLFAVELATEPAGVHRFLDALKLFRIGASWGGYESLAMAPALYTGGRPRRLPATLVRLYCGLEDPADLVADLEQGLAAI